MTFPLVDLGLTMPVIDAPMTGSATTSAVVIAARRAGGLVMLASGYKTPQALVTEIAEVRAASMPFGINVFASNAVPIGATADSAYGEAMQREADTYGVTLPSVPIGDDDDLGAKVELFASHPGPLVSFIFGIPDRNVVRAPQMAGTAIRQTFVSALYAWLPNEADGYRTHLALDMGDIKWGRIPLDCRGLLLSGGGR